ncbi:MAG: zf-HC2 domain-containing protein, partial [Chloroflexi bacterium]|nr:zf-HC2 domain-containing protein [Chloroflexota bacterium]
MGGRRAALAAAARGARAPRPGGAVDERGGGRHGLRGGDRARAPAPGAGRAPDAGPQGGRVSRHPDAALAGYAAGDLAAAERERLDAHLADCAACRDTLAEYRTLLAELAATAAGAAPADTLAWPRYRAELRAR